MFSQIYCFTFVSNFHNSVTMQWTASLTFSARHLLKLLILLRPAATTFVDDQLVKAIHLQCVCYGTW